MKMYHLLLLIFSVSLLATSCSKDEFDPTKQLEKDLAQINQYLTDKGLSAKSTASGLHYIIETEGTGGHPDLSSTVDVEYKGYLLDGSVFDARRTTFPLSNVIEGWQEGIPLFQKGGKGKLLIPSGLGYGNRAAGTIPANSVLVFDIELFGF